MATASRRQQILEAVKARLERIKVGATFQTDAGRNVYVNESPAFGPVDSGGPETAIVVVIGEDAVRVQGNKVFVELPIEIQAIASSERQCFWQLTEPVAADIKRAMELQDRTFDGLVDQWLQRGSTRTLDRDDGSTTVGVGISYRLSHAETWGNP